MARQPEEGLNCLDEAAQLVDSTQERWAEAEMHRERGTLLLSINKYAAAEDSFRNALSVSRGQGGKLFELRAARDLHSFGAIRASGSRPWISSFRSMTGSPKASTHLT